MNPADTELRKMWRDAGGEFYGPHVETGSMPETKLLPFLRSLIAGQPASVGAVRKALEVLALFRAFVQRNVTRWELGAGDHHHPIWALIAETLGDLNRKEFNSGDGWKFIQPRNRECLAAALKSDGPARQPQPVATDQLAGANTANGPSDPSATDTLRDALKTAIGHIEHMSAWIALRNAGYSFESLGEDMPGMKNALSSLEARNEIPALHGRSVVSDPADAGICRRSDSGSGNAGAGDAAGGGLAAVRDDGHSRGRAGADGLDAITSKITLLLRMIDDANGEIDASDDDNSLLNHFCGDRGRTRTRSIWQFNVG